MMQLGITGDNEMKTAIEKIEIEIEKWVDVVFRLPTGDKITVSNRGNGELRIATDIFALAVLPKAANVVVVKSEP